MRLASVTGVFALGGALGLAVAQDYGKKPEKAAAPSLQDMKPPAPIQDKLLDSFVGTWTVKSTFMGQPFEGTAKYEWVLGHQFLKGTEANKGPGWTYEGEGFWRVEGGEYTSWWFDNMGGAGTMKGKLEGSTLKTSGIDPKMGPFRGETKLVGPDEMTWWFEADPERDGTFAKMGEGTSKRVNR
ncbi:MAG TPA: DUF1579 family protein [Planctomycetota bacterium]|jgi:hypothetical protein|nr:DUF1579 family protein [Planctomycetota bacterium]